MTVITIPIIPGPDPFSRNHVFIISVVYQLPFGRGQKYLSGVSKPANLLIGGWQLTQPLKWSSGLPWTPSIGECNDVSDGSVPCRPNIISPAFHTGVSRNPATGVVSFFTPVAPLSYNLLPSLNGQDSCTFARPVSGPFALPAAPSETRALTPSPDLAVPGQTSPWPRTLPSPSASSRNSASMLTTSLIIRCWALTALRATPALTAAALPARLPTSSRTARQVRRRACANCSLVCVSLSNP
jgi:hypothetical protein